MWAQEDREAKQAAKTGYGVFLGLCAFNGRLAPERLAALAFGDSGDD